MTQSAPGPVPPAPEFPDVPRDGTTELRIHGVAGTPVEAMLHHPHPVQVSGDRLAGCFRRGDDHRPLGEPERPDRHLEAYSWGRLTAGSAARAFWLLLLPFALVNVASWAHPVRPAARFAPVGWMSAIARLFALTLTVTFMLGTATIGMDLVAWQCANDPALCGSRHFFTRFMTEHPEAFFAQPGVRIAVGALFPLAALGILVLLSRSTAKAYEQYPAKAPLHPAPPGREPAGHDFGDPGFWAGGRPFERLRSLHAGAALATVAGLVAYAASRPPGPWQALGRALPWLAAALVAGCAAAVASPYAGRRRELLEGRRPPAWATTLMGRAQWAGAALVAVAAWYAAGPAPDPVARSGALPGINRVIAVDFVVQVSLLAAYLVATVWARFRSPGTASQTLLRRTLFLSGGPVALAVLALGVGGAYMSGLVFRVGDYLGEICTRRCSPDKLKIVVDEVYFVSARAALVFVAVAVAVGAGTWLWYLRRRRRCAATVEREYGVAPGTGAGTGPDAERVRRIASLQASAALTDRADAILTLLILPTIAGLLALWLVPYFRGWRPPVTTAGTWLVGLFAVLLVVVGRSAYRSGGSRRVVGILWDLGTFWPRATHPFAPPAYCERVVPEFARRVERLTERGKVVLSAHSQGSVIAVATVHRLGAAGCRKVGLVTYGCPVERLYARLFPHFFGLDSLRAARALVGGRWRNLYRRTDPIGGPVFTLDAEGFACAAPATPPAALDPVDRRLRDPLFEVQPGEFLPPAARGHSDYFHDREFAATVDEVAASIP